MNPVSLKRGFTGWKTGLEPATPRTTIWCSNQLSYNHHFDKQEDLLLRLPGDKNK